MLENTDKLGTILQEHSIRKTKIRLEVLNAFLLATHALSHGDLEKLVSPDADRVTLYRTLNTFEENGLIHRVADNSQSERYALCHHDHLQHQKHDHNHLHFKCKECRQTYCLDDITPPIIELPTSFKVESINVLVTGVCKNCT
jgi:Fur family ferric uptake transcriptional regulator